ncbi:MAG: oxidoreductase [Firmicutes bacterium]|nr:oxidoreductase [Bacillota bacterium]
MLFRHQAIFVKERVGFLKLTDVYDLLDPSTGGQIGQIRDEPSALSKYLRLVVNKLLLPTRFNVYEGDSGQPSLSIVKKSIIVRGHLDVEERGQVLFRLRGKIFSFRGYYDVLAPHSDQIVAEVRGDWKGWNFKLLNPSGGEVGTITKKWAGIGKELFTSADNYMVVLGGEAASFPKPMESLLAVAIALDAVHKERK